MSVAGTGQASANCANCTSTLEQRNSKSYKRKPLTAPLKCNKDFLGVTVGEALEKVNQSNHFSEYVCIECYSLLAKAIKSQQTAERCRSELVRKRPHSCSPLSPQQAEKVARVEKSPQSLPVSESELTDKFARLLSPKPPKGIINAEDDEDSKKFKTKPDFKGRAHLLLSHSSYGELFRLLWRKSNSARMAMTNLLASVVNKETVRYIQNSEASPLSKPVSLSTLTEFKWETVSDQMRQEMPLLSRVLASAAVSSVAYPASEAVLGTVLSMLLHHRSPKKFNFVQNIHGVEMWLAGSYQKLFQTFHRLGWATGVKGTRSLVDKLRKEGDVDLRTWKKQVEAEMMSADKNPQHLADEDQESETLEWEECPDIAAALEFAELAEAADLLAHDDSEEEFNQVASGAEVSMESEAMSDDSDADLSTSSDDGEDPIPPSVGLHAALHQDQGSSSGFGRSSASSSDLKCGPGYQLCWDNIQLHSESKHQGPESKDRFMLMALAYAAENRIDFTHLEKDKDTVPAVDLPLTAFLPNAEVYASLRQRMIVIVMRILVDNFNLFKDFSEVTPEHIPHQYSEEMAKKSSLTNLGVIDGNPSSAQGTLQIMSRLHELVPVVKEVPYRLLCSGDGLSVERMIQALKNAAMRITTEERVEGLEPVIQEFHKRGTIAQDTYEEMYRDDSLSDVGTVSHIMNRFLKHFKPKAVMHCFNHAIDNLHFTTEGLVCILVMYLYNISSIEDCPEKLGSEDCSALSEEEKAELLTKVAARVVAECWKGTPLEDVEEVCAAVTDTNCEEEDYNQWCCKQDTGETMLACSNSTCTSRWYHLSCVGLTPDTVPDGDWWCSPRCRKHSLRCHCKLNKPGRLVECSQGATCTSGQFFHWTCVGIESEPEEAWYCSTECLEKTDVDKPDYVKEYSQTLLWHGLMDMVCRDAVREGDGEFILKMWRVHMVQFWNRRHPKYLIFGHRLLSGANGWYPPRLAAEATWNRTVNLSGGPGKNIAMDLANEFLNNKFVTLMKASHGRYTEQHISRVSEMAGPLCDSIDELYQHKVAQTHVAKSRSQKPKAYRASIKEFAKVYGDAQLFATVPGRQHEAFPQFQHSVRIQNPAKLRAKLEQLGKKLDRSRIIQPQC